MTLGRDDWLQAGWKRGAFIDLKSQANSQLFDLLPNDIKAAVNEKRAAYLIPVLNDCALVHDSFETEPYVQVTICYPCEKNNAFCNLKQPRTYHFPLLKNGEEQYFECLSRIFLTIERQLLLNHTPDDTLVWPELGLDKLLNWLADRFRQPTFPDEWNFRLDKKQGRFHSLWKSEKFGFCSGVYISIHPFSEISPDEIYDVSVLILAPEEFDGKTYRHFNKNDAPELISRLKSILDSISNLNIKSVNTISEGAFTKSMERQYKRWSLEYYSYSRDGSTFPLE